MGIQINGQTDIISATDGSLTVSGADFTSISAGTTSTPSISPTGDSNTGIFFPSADTVCIGEGGSEVIRVNSSGLVGIGSDSPTAPLNVVNNNASTPTVWLRNTSGGGDSPVLRVQGGANNDNVVGTFEVRDYDGNVDFKVGGTGNITIGTGNLIIGTSGKGIDFSATSDSSGTMTSELLADYEEGTWTPAITGSTSGTVNSGNRVGTYTKIGRLVTARFTFVNPSATTISGTWRLTGLPFSGRASSNEYIGGYVHYNRNINKAGDWLSIFQEASTSFTYFRVMGNYMNGTETYDISGNWPADVLFAGTIFYEAA